MRRYNMSWIVLVLSHQVRLSKLHPESLPWPTVYWLEITIWELEQFKWAGHLLMGSVSVPLDTAHSETPKKWGQFAGIHTLTIDVWNIKEENLEANKKLLAVHMIFNSWLPMGLLTSPRLRLCSFNMTTGYVSPYSCRETGHKESLNPSTKSV